MKIKCYKHINQLNNKILTLMLMFKVQIQTYKIIRFHIGWRKDPKEQNMELELIEKINYTNINIF